MSTRISVNVSAHHNVEDFRPYKISFIDRGERTQNIITALTLAIKREAQWIGWFDDYGCLECETVASVRALIEKAIVDGNEEVNIPIWEREDLDGDERAYTRSTTHVFAIWFVESDKNYGFGEGKLNAVGNAITDKYCNKWVGGIA
jgi:hypothetical protein